MAKCRVCGKIGMFGHNVSHSKRATNMRQMPNVHRLRLEIEGRVQRLKLCTRCIRTYYKART
jgi:large subunit ribosomal protein L28